MSNELQRKTPPAGEPEGLIPERKYRKPPVVEALCEIYFADSTWDDTVPGVFYERATFRSLLNFNEFRIFESALGQHNMVSLFERGKDPDISVLTATTKRVGFATPLPGRMSGLGSCAILQEV